MLEDKQNQPEFNTANYTSQERVPLRPITRVVMGSDLVQFRMAKPPSASLQEKLERHCLYSGPVTIPMRERDSKGHWRIRMVPLKSRERSGNKQTLWQVTAPEHAALECIPDDWELVRVELCRNWLTDDRSRAHRMHDSRDAAFVIIGPVSREARNFNADDGTRTGYNGDFASYVSECKLTGSPNCLHEERRVIGARQLKRLGLRTAADLLNFDHAAFWEGVDRRYWRALDLIELGRHLRRLQLGQKRLPPRWVHVSHGFRYDVDRAHGAHAARVILHDMHTNDQGRFFPDDDQSQHLAQQVANRFGAGPWLKLIGNPLMRFVT